MSSLGLASKRAFHGQNKLNRRERFVSEYLVDLNGTQAAIRAGYSEKTAGEQAARLLANVRVRTAVNEGLERMAAKAEVTAQEVIQGIRRTIARCEGPGPEFQPFVVLKGYELLGKYLKMWTEKFEVSGLDGIAERMARGRQAVADLDAGNA